jgi:hypothetical protein
MQQQHYTTNNNSRYQQSSRGIGRVGRLCAEAEQTAVLEKSPVCQRMASTEAEEIIHDIDSNQITSLLIVAYLLLSLKSAQHGSSSYKIMAVFSWPGCPI